MKQERRTPSTRRALRKCRWRGHDADRVAYPQPYDAGRELSARVPHTAAKPSAGELSRSRHGWTQVGSRKR